MARATALKMGQSMPINKDISMDWRALYSVVLGKSTEVLNPDNYLRRNFLGSITQRPKRPMKAIAAAMISIFSSRTFDWNYYPIPVLQGLF